jgi:hypothetical protein
MLSATLEARVLKVATLVLYRGCSVSIPRFIFSHGTGGQTNWRALTRLDGFTFCVFGCLALGAPLPGQRLRGWGRDCLRGRRACDGLWSQACSAGFVAHTPPPPPLLTDRNAPLASLSSPTLPCLRRPLKQLLLELVPMSLALLFALFVPFAARSCLWLALFVRMS